MCRRIASRWLEWVLSKACLALGGSSPSSLDQHRQQQADIRLIRQMIQRLESSGSSDGGILGLRHDSCFRPTSNGSGDS
ncbi:hypothetical protein [Rubripirellula lacrimiformis]|uniref:hypothetical protein n=1 Tax=Rubripirellula lacrimiformis TaxID=1930273 RepID=UPI001C54EC59|nr:hypothetical protein [Rubripirellula lacrimiformis]